LEVRGINSKDRVPADRTSKVNVQVALWKVNPWNHPK